MSGSLNEGLLFLINTIFNLYLFILFIRLILVWVRSDYFNPVTQFVVRFTDFMIKPTRRFVPNYKNIETSTILFIFLIELLKFLVISLLTFGMPTAAGLVLLALVDMLSLLIQVFTYAIILQAVLSWVQPYSPVNRVLYQFTAPVVQPFQRLIPPVGGFDISMIPALILLQLLNIVLVNPLMQIATQTALGV